MRTPRREVYSDARVIRVWDAQGKTIASLTGHKDYIYQVVASASGIVSCGEDHTAVSLSPGTRLTTAGVE